MLPLPSTLLVMFSLSSLCGAVTYYVTPTPPPNPNCPHGTPCYTVDHYAENSDELFHGKVNVSLLFMNGTHTLTVDLSVSEVENLLFSGLHNSDTYQNHTILLLQTRESAIFAVRQLQIKFMTLSISQQGKCFSVDATTLLLYNTSLINCDMLAHSDLMINLIDVVFYRASFQLYQVISSKLFNNTGHDPLFGHLGKFEPSMYFNESSPSESLEITLTSCKIVHASSSGVEIFVRLPMIANISLSIGDTTIADSSKAGVSIVVRDAILDLKVENTTIAGNQHGGIILLGKNSSAHFELHNSTVNDNQHGGIVVGLDTSDINVDVRNTTFEGNKNSMGSPPMGLATSTLVVRCTHHFSMVRISDVTVRNNIDYSLHGSIVSISGCDKTIFEGNNIFESNTGTPVQLYLSDLSISGKSIFRGNHAEQGGGLSLLYSKIMIFNNTMITFEMNCVDDNGGAIYVRTMPALSSSYYCFYQLPDLSIDNIDLNINVTFINNSALNGGGDIYGAGLQDQCCVSENNPSIMSYAIQRDVFKFSELQPTLSRISSDPMRVCLCDEKYLLPRCVSMPYIFSVHDAVFPGEEFSVYAVVVGADFGSISASVYVNLVPTTTLVFLNGTLNSLISQFAPYAQCTKLVYSIPYYPVEEETFVLALTASYANIFHYGDENSVHSLINNYHKHNATSPFDNLLSLPVFVNVSVESCPVGFILSKTFPFKCVCGPFIAQVGVGHCVIQSHVGVLYRSGTVWVRGNQTTGELIGQPYCPHNYCKSNNVSLVLDDPDKQCVANRSGILCGGCSGGSSLALGSSRCIHCEDNSFVALVIPIAIGMIFLVFSIKVLDLTVSKGTINGLIFYANVIWMYRSILLQRIDNHDALHGIAYVFVAWLNLDIGFELCFVKGFDAYGKRWLYFGQDFFVLIVLTALICVSARYSTKVTRLLGSNIVSVLATMFFLSYAKLLNNITDTLGFSILQSQNSTISVVRWSLDGNLEYFGLKHSALLVVALAALLFLWSPYTFVLLLAQFLRGKTSYRLLHWINSQKPFFDAYFAPLKDKHHYWFGLLLLVRGFLVIVYSVFYTFSSESNMLVVSVVATLLILHPQPYSSQLLTMLEKSFFLNLMVLGSSVIFLQAISHDEAIGAVVVVSIGIVLLQFFGIIAYHSFMTIKLFCRRKYGRFIGEKNFSNSNRYTYSDLDKDDKKSDSKFRESLLENSVSYT